MLLSCLSGYKAKLSYSMVNQLGHLSCDMLLAPQVHALFILIRSTNLVKSGFVSLQS